MPWDAERRIAIGRLLLGARLRDVRNQRDFALADIAEAAGISKSYLSDVEHGRRLPKLDVLDSLARSLGVTVTALLADLYPWDSDEEPALLTPVRDERRRS